MADDLYAQPSELKAYLRIEDGNDDNQLIDALQSTSRGIDRFCGRRFTKDEVASARLFYPRNGCEAKVDDFWTTDGLIVETGDGITAAYPLTWTTDTYQLEPVNGVIDGEPWPYTLIRAITGWFPYYAQRAPLRVTAQWGWPAVPAAVKQACLIVAAEAFKLRDAPFGVAGFGDFGVVRVRDNPIAVGKLAPYQRGTARFQVA